MSDSTLIEFIELLLFKFKIAREKLNKSPKDQ